MYNGIINQTALDFQILVFQLDLIRAALRILGVSSEQSPTVYKLIYEIQGMHQVKGGYGFYRSHTFWWQSQLFNILYTVHS